MGDIYVFPSGVRVREGLIDYARGYMIGYSERILERAAEIAAEERAGSVAFKHVWRAQHERHAEAVAQESAMVIECSYQ